MTISEMTIGKKLYIASSIAVLTTVLMGVSAWIGMAKREALVSELVGAGARKVALSAAIKTAVLEMAVEERAIVFGTAVHDSARVNEADEQFQHSLALLENAISTITPLLGVTEGSKPAAEIGRSQNEFAANHKALIAAAANANAAAAGALFDSKVSPALTRAGNYAGELTQLQITQLASAGKEAFSSVGASRWVMATILLITLVASAILFIAIRGLNTKIATAVEEMAQSAGEVNAASSQISSASHKLAQASCEQAACIEETSASTEEIGAMTRRNSDNSKSAARLMDDAVHGFVKSNHLLDEMLHAMDGISDSSGKISRIIKVIDEIAFQTNILALNAAVEAARAGEAGMGFAVVADEVRNLAQRSAQAARDTATLIEDSIARSHEGKSKVSETSHSIRTLSEQVSQIKILIDEVTLGSVEQTRGVEQIAKALSQMDRATQSTGASAEQTASSANELYAQAETLRCAIARLRFMFTGSQDSEVQRRDRPSGSRAFPAPSGWSNREAKSFTSSVSSLGKATQRPLTEARDEFPLEESFSDF